MIRPLLSKFLILGLIFLFFVGMLEVFTLIIFKLDRWRVSDYIVPSNGVLSSGQALEFLYKKGLNKSLKPNYPPIANHNNAWLTLMSCSEAVKDKASIRLFKNLYYAELDHSNHNDNYSRSLNFNPHTIWRNSECSSLFYNVNSNGVRKTDNTYIKNKDKLHKIFVFGGSTTFGTGVEDSQTIPSHLSRIFNNENNSLNYEVTNYGASAFILDQDLNTFLKLLKNGEKPNTVIFYGGFNDVFSALVEPGKNGWSAKSRMIDYKLNQRESVNDEILLLNNTRKLSQHIYKKLQNKGFYKVNYNKPSLVRKSDINFIKKSLNDSYENGMNNSDSFISYYRSTIKIIKDLCDLNEINCFFFWQPTLLFNKKRLYDFERSIVENDSLIAFGSFDPETGKKMRLNIIKVYSKLNQKKMFDNMHWINLSNIFDNVDDPIYIDCIHLGPTGNACVAENIYKMIKDKIYQN